MTSSLQVSSLRANNKLRLSFNVIFLFILRTCSGCHSVVSSCLTCKGGGFNSWHWKVKINDGMYKFLGPGADILNP